MTEATMEAALSVTLAHLLFAAQDEEFPENLPELWTGLDSVETFAQAGLLTSNRGIVLRMQDGSEFQLTIVKRR